MRCMMGKPNVLLIVLDTTRADTVSGFLEQGALPGLQKFSNDGAVFQSAYSNAPWTLPSHASMFTGQRASAHATHAGSPQFSPDVPPLPKLFSKAGYETRGISGNSWVSSEFGFDEGFDYLSTKFDRYWGGDDLSKVAKASGLGRVKKLIELMASREAPITFANLLHDQLLNRRTDAGAKGTTDRTIDWLRSRERQEPFFYFINYLEPHLPYNPPDEYREQFCSIDHSKVNQDPWEYVAGTLDMTPSDFDALSDLYRAEIAYLDHHLERLYDALDATGYLEDTVVVLTADHGENIGDHGLMDHQYSLHDTLLHVPLILRYPEEIDAGEQSDLVELRDLYPTLCTLAGIGYPDDESVSSTVIHAQGRTEVFAEYRYPQPDMESLHETVTELADGWQRYDRALRSVRTNDWKLIEAEDGEVQLFRAGDESATITAANPSVVDKLQEMMDEEAIQLARGDSESIEVSDATEERLEDLGYV
ncbi:hypothetical protein DJ84_22000 [Halorubrum ezzemoulense]|nr:hypothetical protein DJ84_22000 [Halorubrum ezzemoulense]